MWTWKELHRNSWSLKFEYVCACVFVHHVVLHCEFRGTVKGRKISMWTTKSIQLNTIRLQLIEFEEKFILLIPFDLYPISIHTLYTTYAICIHITLHKFPDELNRRNVILRISFPSRARSTPTYIQFNTHTHAYIEHFQETARGKIDEVKLQRLPDNGSFNSHTLHICEIDKWKYLHCIVEMFF